MYWVERTAERGLEIRERAIAKLVARGILDKPEDDGFLSLTPEVAHARRYPSTNGTTQEDIKLRVMRVLFSDDIPDPADIVIITLIDACAVWRKVLSAEELAKARERIQLVSRLDLIGQAVAALVRVVRPTAHSARDGAGGPPLVTALSLWRDPRAFFLQQYQRLGPVFRVKTLGRNFVVMAGQEANLFMSRSERLHLHTADMWDPLCAELGASRFVLNMDGKDHVRMRREMKSGLSRLLLERQIPKAVNVVRRHLAAMPLNTRALVFLPFPAIQRLVGEMTGVVVAGSSAEEYIDDVRVVLKKLVTRGFLRIPQLPKTPRLRRALRRVAELSDKLLLEHQLRHGERRANAIDDMLELHRADPMFLPECDLPLTALFPLFGGLDTFCSSALLSVPVFSLSASHRGKQGEPTSQLASAVAMASASATYSIRRAASGSTRAARRAGT